MRYAILIGCIWIAAAVAHAYESPDISIVQGSEKGKSVLIIKWEDGSEDSLVYEDKVEGKKLVEWFNDRCDEHEKKQK